MKLIHTSDILLDSGYSSEGLPPEVGNRCRRGLREALERILDRAASWPADAVIIAGGLYLGDRVSRETVTWLRQAFEKIRPIPVFITPGIRDPYVPVSPYATEAWPANVYIFRQRVWSAHALTTIPLTVHGFAHDGGGLPADHFQKIGVEQDDRVHVALCHAKETAVLPDAADAAGAFNAMDLPPTLAYVALGGHHNVASVPETSGPVARYSGSPEGHGFHETGDHFYLEVEIQARSGGAPEVKVQTVPASRTRFTVQTIDCGTFTNADALVRAVRDRASSEHQATLARITLTGECAPALRPEMDGLEEVVAPHFAYLEWSDETAPEEAYEDLARESSGPGLFAAQMNRELKDATDAVRETLLRRARQVGLAAYRGRNVPVRGAKGDEA
jgi:DNA repair exonuclease SbcCD nuclease subunit